MSKTKEFQALLTKPDATGSWTYFTLPFDAVAEYEKKGHIKVKGKIDSHPFRSSLMPHGDGKHYLVVNRAIRESIGKSAGDMVTVVMGLDSAPRTVTVPNDLKKTLEKNRSATDYFEAMAYSHKKTYVDWIEQAKKNETRERRILKAMNMLSEGKKLK